MAAAGISAVLDHRSASEAVASAARTAATSSVVSAASVTDAGVVPRPMWPTTGVKTVPPRPKPTTMPSPRAVDMMPEASPRRSRGAPPRMALAIGAVNRPRPRLRKSSNATMTATATARLRSSPCVGLVQTQGEQHQAKTERAASAPGAEWEGQSRRTGVGSLREDGSSESAPVALVWWSHPALRRAGVRHRKQVDVNRCGRYLLSVIDARRTRTRGCHR
jgi:hypothetical protein